MRKQSKEIIISPTVSKSNLDDFLSRLKDITIIKVDPKLVSGKKFKIIFESEDADIVICKTIEELKKAAYGKVPGY